MPLLQTPEFTTALQRWREGEFWEVHEALEPLWMRLAGPRREFTQGVILLAAALHKAKSSTSGGWRNFHKALRHLGGLPDPFETVDVTGLINEVRRALEQSSHPPKFPVR
jgi:predicted metal-dependent hydrolase